MAITRKKIVENINIFVGGGSGRESQDSFQKNHDNGIH